jgi:hypothetical protein
METLKNAGDVGGRTKSYCVLQAVLKNYGNSSRRLIEPNDIYRVKLDFES